MGLADAAHPAAGTPAIHVGRDAWIDAAVPDLRDLDDDGFVLESLDADRLVIAGPTVNGTRHGICDFLERVLGVRWLLPGPLGQVLPQRSLSRLPELHERCEPGFISRTQPGLSTPAQQQWGRRMRLHERLCGATHSLQSLLAPSRYAETHPHFFPLVDGKRYLSPGGWDWHPCFCAEGLAEELARLAIEHFRAHPQDRCFSLAISDGAVHCECDRCLAHEQGRRNSIAMRHVSEQYFTCMNRVAELVTDVFPDRLLGGLAYANVYDPPALPLHPSFVLFHTYDRHKWIDQELETRGHAGSRAWAATGARMAWYDYTFGAGLLIPRVYAHQMAANYRFAHDVGVIGIAAETCHNWVEAPKYYVLARLQWDPKVDVDEVLREWYELAVGPVAAGHLQAFYDFWEQLWAQRLPTSPAFSTQGQQWLPIQDDSHLGMVTVDDMRFGRVCLEQAQAGAATEPQRQRAQLLLRGYAFCEAAVLGRLPDRSAGQTRTHSAADAIALVQQAVEASEWIARSQAIDAELSSDEVLKRTVVPWWSGTDRRGWGVYPLWRCHDLVRDDDTVRKFVRGIAAGASALAPWARALVQAVDGSKPLMSLRLDASIDLLSTNERRRTKEPGESMPEDRWQVCNGDDVEPFWNPPKSGATGHIEHVAADSPSSAGALRFVHTAFATTRHRVHLPAAPVVVMCFVRCQDPAARVELRLWQIRWSDHNPSPWSIALHAPVDEWVPLALAVDLTPVSDRPYDYQLVEIAVESAHSLVEIADVSIWPA